MMYSKHSAHLQNPARTSDVQPFGSKTFSLSHLIQDITFICRYFSAKESLEIGIESHHSILGSI